jgi:sugar/nucleoside kinase (ribokinase family)
MTLALRANQESGFTCAIGVGGIGSGIMYSLYGKHDLGRNESRLGELLDSRDYCKLHILEHYIAKLMGAGSAPDSFRVLPIGVVGNDVIGTQILGEMSAAGLDLQFMRRDPSLKTLFSVCFIYPDGSGGNITSGNSAARTVSAEDLKLASPLMKAAGRRALVLCVPEVPLELRRKFLEMATHCGNYRACSFVLGDMEEARKTGLIALTDLLALNQEETSALLGCPSGHTLDEKLLAESAAKYTATLPALRLVMSAGSKGAYGFEGGRMQYCPAPVLRPKSTAGAGDALLAGVASALAAGIPFIMPDEGGKSFSGRVLRTALDFGVLNSSFSVTSEHSIHPDAGMGNLFAFAEQQGASISETIRSACYESE